MIDSHQHFWCIDKNDCTWPTAELAAIYRDFLPADLAPIAERAGVTGTVLVQSQESDADTDFLLALASESALIKAVVGWVDLASAQAPERIAALATHPKMRGLRPMLQGLHDDSWILDPNLGPAIEAMLAAQLSLDALVFSRHLPHLRVFAKRHPRMAIVIDHAAKPAIASGEFAGWASAISAMAELPQVYCKLSGLLTEAGSAQGVAELRPYVEHLYQAFGAQRLMWGSDWPVLNVAAHKSYGDYGAWLGLAKELLPFVREAELAAIFGGAAQQFYRF